MTSPTTELLLEALLENIKRDWLDLVTGDAEVDTKLEKLRATVLHFVRVAVENDNRLRQLDKDYLERLRGGFPPGNVSTL